MDKSDAYYLDAAYSEKSKRQMFFGAAQIKKRYVSFYLMPTYAFPDLLKGISPALKKRMQGKMTCVRQSESDFNLRMEPAQIQNHKSQIQNQKSKWSASSALPITTSVATMAK